TRSRKPLHAVRWRLPNDRQRKDPHSLASSAPLETLAPPMHGEPESRNPAQSRSREFLLCRARLSLFRHALDPPRQYLGRLAVLACRTVKASIPMLLPAEKLPVESPEQQAADFVRRSEPERPSPQPEALL